MRTVTHKLTVAEYEHLAEIIEDDRTELIDGEVIWMSPIGSRHFACVGKLQALLLFHIGQSAIVNSQGPIWLSDSDRPQPDIVCLRWRDDWYALALPHAADVQLVIEVADSPLSYDRQSKGPLYAGAGIPEYWIVNLVDNQIEIYTDPTMGGYQMIHTVRPGETFTAPVMPGLTLSASYILLLETDPPYAE